MVPAQTSKASAVRTDQRPMGRGSAAFLANVATLAPAPRGGAGEPAMGGGEIAMLRLLKRRHEARHLRGRRLGGGARRGQMPARLAPKTRPKTRPGKGEMGFEVI